MTMYTSFQGMNETALRLLREIEKMDIIDAHEHLPSEADRVKSDADALTLFSHYCRGDLKADGMDEDTIQQVFYSTAPLEERWRKFKPHYANISNTAYVKAAETAMEKYYGAASLTDDNLFEVSERVRRANKPGLYRRVLREDCGIVTCLSQDCGKSDDGLITPVVWRLANLRDYAGVVTHSEFLGREVKTLEDIEETTEKHIAKIKKDGGVGVKLMVYPMEDYDRRAAQETLDHLCRHRNEDLPLRNPLTNFCFDKVITEAGKQGLVVCLHSGYWFDFRNLHPAFAIYMAGKYPDVRFDLYHTGYPYVREAILLGKTRPNIWLNLCWTYIISPHFAYHTLLEMLEMVPHNKIIGFGGDYRVVEKVYSHLLMARRVISEALAAKVSDGWFTFDQAVDVAHKMLYDNPKALYNL